jgi:hypothetical protein
VERFLSSVAPRIKIKNYEKDNFMTSLNIVCTEMQSFFPTGTNTRYKIENYSSYEILVRKMKFSYFLNYCREQKGLKD